ncbi:MAG TPA: nicotinamide riboside transporter PnuC [Gemmatimonadaceae bacterium]|nr:nicotinamide riboside transporter PnuC [Gemmatimonadaceae bacterium]
MSVLCTWLTAHGMSCLELVAATIGLISVFLAIPESVWNWPTGIVNVAMYAFLFVKQGYYANAGLQIVYLVLSIYGWYEWLHGGRARSELHVSRASRRAWMVSIAVGVATWVLLFTVTRRLPGDAFSYTDAATVAASLVAEWMLAKKLIDNWALWIVVDAVYVAMFIAGRNYLTAVNYIGYFVLAVMGYVAWRRVLAAQTQTATPA